jgi:AraC family transcriptional regulator
VANMTNHLLSAKKMLEVLLATPVTTINFPSPDLSSFETAYSFHPEHQPMYTSIHQNRFIEKMDRHTFYELCDPLETAVILFYIGDDLFIIGPYTTSVWNDDDAALRLSSLGISSNHLNSYKLYYCQFSVLSSELVIRGATALVDMSPSDTEPMYYSYKKIVQKSGYSKNDIIVPDKYTYDNVNQHYDIEDKFLKGIEEGNEAMALKALNALSTLPRKPSHMWNQYSGPASLRTIVRLAAKRSGLPYIVIDAISSEYAQKMYHVGRSGSEKRISDLSREMVRELCGKIRSYRNSNYSSLVRKAIGYIELNLAQNLTTACLAEELGVSAGYLSKCFKAETGKTITLFVMEKRTEKAADLLNSSDLPINHISTYVGYLDSNYFIKIFKAHYGITPSDYRKKYKL